MTELFKNDSTRSFGTDRPERSDRKPHINNNHDKVNKPNHYIGLYGLEVEEVLRNFIPKYTDGYVAHRISSSIEYSLRSPEKNGLEDLKKARKNMDQAIHYWESKTPPRS